MWTDNGDGTLSAKAETKSGEDMNGHRIPKYYEARPASVTLGASHRLIGSGAERIKQFTFVLQRQGWEKRWGVEEKKNGCRRTRLMFETLIVGTPAGVLNTQF